VVVKEPTWLTGLWFVLAGCWPCLCWRDHPHGPVQPKSVKSCCSHWGITHIVMKYHRLRVLGFSSYPLPQTVTSRDDSRLKGLPATHAVTVHRRVGTVRMLKGLPLAVLCCCHAFLQGLTSSGAPACSLSSLCTAQQGWFQQISCQLGAAGVVLYRTLMFQFFCHKSTTPDMPRNCQLPAACSGLIALTVAILRTQRVRIDNV
jgi:hypothetical protein